MLPEANANCHTHLGISVFMFTTDLVSERIMTID